LIFKVTQHIQLTLKQKENLVDAIFPVVGSGPWKGITDGLLMQSY